MARPQKFRRICSMPKNNKFSPEKKACGKVYISIDEYEVLRLLDYEEMTQEQCAVQMNVGRATITLIYESVRKKIADCLVNGKSLVIEGGNIALCENAENCCGKCGKGMCGECTEKNCKNQK